MKKFARFVSKQGMDIDGLSVQTIIKFINLGYIARFDDIYKLSEHGDEIRSLEGFGDRSCENILNAVKKSRKTDPVHFIYALCIPLIGTDAAKKIIAATGYQGFIDRLAQKEGFEDIDGIGPEKSNSIMAWYEEEKNRDVFTALLAVLDIEKAEPKTAAGGRCSGLTFVITGEVHHFKNRNEFKAYVEHENGAVTGSVSKKTDYLVNNDTESVSSKNTKAKALGIPIISETKFLEMFS